MSYSDDEFEDYDDDFEDDAPASPVRKAESKPVESPGPGSSPTKRQSKGKSRQLIRQEEENGADDAEMGADSKHEDEYGSPSKASKKSEQRSFREQGNFENETNRGNHYDLDPPRAKPQKRTK